MNTWIVALALAAQGAIASPSVKNGADCSALLSLNNLPVDYAVSDLEGLFFDFVEKVQNAGEIPASRHEYLVKEILDLKANILNEVAGLLPLVLRNVSENPEKAAQIATLYQIIDTLGIPPSIYGLKVDRRHNIVAPYVPGSRDNAEAPPAQNPIGFLTKPGARERDLLPGQKRSIGFGRFELRRDAPPARAPAQYRRAMAKGHQNILLIVDNLTGKTFAADMRILMTTSAASKDNQFHLEFNTEIGEWIVRVVNLNNPTGRIGFL